MDYRFADFKDIPRLAEANAQLIVDEGRREPLQPGDLERRFWDWLSDEYRAVMFEEDGRLLGYALYRNTADHVLLRQFFIQRDLRRKGLGREAFELLCEEIWKPDVRVRVESLSSNPASREFWHEMGFSEHAVLLELDQAAQSGSEAATAS